ncbi:MAG: HEAT repeat domain-containing protein [Verrucomicrobiae bacterium]|nr:HEAT repeat domain-containing protein [Verrucomicrobiae bacterium]
MRCSIDDAARRGGLAILWLCAALTAGPSSLLGVPGTGAPAAPASTYDLAKRLTAGPEWTEERCLELALKLGLAETRQEALDAIAASKEFPASLWVALLTHPSLEIRLGALDVLEDRAGSDLDYDPWDPDPNRRHAASQTWEEWLASGGANAAPFEYQSPFRPESMQVWLADVLSGDTARTERAIARMQPHHREAIAGIEAHFPLLGDSADGLKARLKEAQYRLLLSAASVGEGRRIARLLATGNRDEVVEALDALEGAPVSVMPLVGDGLRDADPLVRERAMDLLLGMGKAAAIPLVRDHLEKDDDSNVLHAAIRGLGKIEGAESVRTLVPYLKGDDEDRVAAALQSLSLLGEAARNASDSVLPCLDHPSWRVRAGALQFLIKTRASADPNRIVALLDDEDSFVRTTAVSALTSRSGSSGGSLPKEVEEALGTAVEKRPDLLGPVLRSFDHSDLTVPETLLKSLSDAPADLMVTIAPSLNPDRPAELAMLEKLAASPDRDLAAAALGALASSPDASDQVRRIMIDALLGDSEEDREVVLSKIKVPSRGKVTSRLFWEQAVEALSTGASAPRTEGGEAPEVSKKDDAVDDLFGAFGLGEKPPPEAPASTLDDAFAAFGLGEDPGPAPSEPIQNPAPSANLDDLNAAFFGTEPTAAPPDAPARPASAGTIRNAKDALAQLADSAPFGKDREGRDAFRAASLLIKAGDTRPVTKLVASIGSLSVQDRSELADLVSDNPQPDFLPLWTILLSDEAAAVRSSAFRGALDDDFPVLFGHLLREATQPGHPAEFPDLYSSYFEYLAENRETKKIFAEAGRRLASKEYETASRVFGLVMLRSSQSTSDAATIEACLADPDEWVRRAAAFALGSGNPAAFQGQLAKLASDSSVWVREAAAAAAGKNLAIWTHRFSGTEEMADEKNLSESDYGFSSSSRASLFGPRKTKTEETTPEIEVLLQLTGDVSPRVRLAAWASLLSRGVAVDMPAMAALIAESSERERWVERLVDWIDEGGNQFNPAQREAASFLARSTFDAKSMGRVESKFAAGSKGDLALDFSGFAAAPSATPDESAAEEAKTTTPGAPQEETANDRVTALFFFTPGCHECDEVRDHLVSLQNRFPGLIIDERNIRDTSAVLLNEALCSRFGVDPQLRLATPSVFLQEGALIKEEITKPALHDLVEQTVEVGDLQLWLGVEAAELAASKLEVESRFAALGIAGVFLAGLLDGVNPCAFATIIFFLSYLQVARRTPREILAVGVAFILAVFLTYLLLGMGLVEVVSRIDAFRTAGKILNLLLAGACLWVAWASFRDAKLARQGRLSEMSLQLPGFLKDRIRSVTRTGVRHRRFVVAAFVSGIVISVLELACTGQVYLPTIVFAMKSGYGKATWFLLVYNLAFVIPLIVVFILAWRGMGSEKLVEFQKRRTALVKTALGCLFLVLFFALLASGRL